MDILRFNFIERKDSQMRNPLLMILLLGLILISLIAPFSGLALLMIVLLGSAFLWTTWTLVRTLISGDVNQTSEKG